MTQQTDLNECNPAIIIVIIIVKRFRQISSPQKVSQCCNLLLWFAVPAQITLSFNSNKVPILLGIIEGRMNEG